MGFDNEKSWTSESTNRLVDYDVYLDVIDSIKEKDEQIKILLEVQKQTQNLLDQQQRLALQDKKILEEYKAEIKDLKALNMPPQDIKTENSSPKETTDYIKGSPQKPNKKKWWQFKKTRAKK